MSLSPCLWVIKITRCQQVSVSLIFRIYPQSALSHPLPQLHQVYSHLAQYSASALVPPLFPQRTPEGARKHLHPKVPPLLRTFCGSQIHQKDFAFVSEVSEALEGQRLAMKQVGFADRLDVGLDSSKLNYG